MSMGVINYKPLDIDTTLEAIVRAHFGDFTNTVLDSIASASLKADIDDRQFRLGGFKVRRAPRIGPHDLICRIPMQIKRKLSLSRALWGEWKTVGRVVLKQEFRSAIVLPLGKEKKNNYYFACEAAFITSGREHGNKIDGQSGFGATTKDLLTQAQVDYFSRTVVEAVKQKSKKPKKRHLPVFSFFGI